MNDMDRNELARQFLVELVCKADPDNIAEPQVLADYAVRLADALIARLRGIREDYGVMVGA